MPRNKVTFKNQQGESLAGILEMPTGPACSYALFAHCFTCSKDIAAATRISRALAKQGIAVLRFDFTGLGHSEGDFSDTNFSSNLQDLKSAANYLQQHYEAPSVLIGHSLGGAAVLAVASQLDHVKAVVTIGAPATATHIQHLFAKQHDEIMSQNAASVELDGRNFTIKRQLIEDLVNYQTVEHIKTLGKALLIFHSPIDQIVSIDEAAKIYSAAVHPKSFVSLDQADHLLTHAEDTEYVAAVITAWVKRYIATDQKETATNRPSVKPSHVVVHEQDKKFTREIFTANHQLISDEPIEMNGADRGPTPYDLLLAALGSCTSMTLRMYANHKKLDLEDIKIELQHNRIHAEDCDTCNDQEQLIDQITRTITLTGDLTEQQRTRLLEIADKCPVHKTLENQIHIVTKI